MKSIREPEFQSEVLKHPEKVSESFKSWVNRNREKRNAWFRGYNKKPEVKIKLYARISDRYHKKRGNECIACKSKENLNFHHTDYEKREGVTLCRSCHLSLHNQKVKEDVRNRYCVNIYKDDFDEIVNAATLDVNWTVASGSSQFNTTWNSDFFIGYNASVSRDFEVIGFASLSQVLLVGNRGIAAATISGDFVVLNSSGLPVLYINEANSDVVGI
ncbi:hypothetical protein IIA15_05680, partial [candidate division TA06 bacterium]|nr:hypothetical protein [candidate division TA06 bacterium]